MWEEIARDRARFQRRIESLRPILEPILLAEHRMSRHVSETSSFPKTRSDQHKKRGPQNKVSRGTGLTFLNEKKKRFRFIHILSYWLHI